ncbi:MAG TPA: RNA polymerase sigma factor [Tepidisphaeraceae bacterium]|jgi:RNA polymerase sigma factor (sigma-70 family)|nr:RNA polymerase sigma factor [Tepidisphaeraceae bacterium]
MTESGGPGEVGDAELLSRFVASREDGAFAEIVHRHGPMVLGVCRRVLRHQQDAEDAFQATFLVLAMQASTIRDPSMLAGWLFGVARQTALRVRDAGRRRRAAEHRFREKGSMPTDTSHDDPEFQAILEAELDRLSPKHRTPVVMCYLEGKANREAARLLGWPVGTLATRLREARALLRGRLARRGFGTAEEAMPEKLSRSLAPAVVPATLATSTVKTALGFSSAPAATAASQQVISVAKSVVKVMAYGKAKTAIIGALALLFVTGSGIGVTYYVMRDASSTSASFIAVQTPAARAAPRFTWQEPPRPTTRPAPYVGPPVKGEARLPNGAPAAGAQVFVATSGQSVYLSARGSGTRAAGIADSSGHFEFGPIQPPQCIVVQNEQGIGYSTITAGSGSVTVSLKPWARVEGTAYLGQKPFVHGQLDAWSLSGNTYRWDAGMVPTDATGHFVLDRVPPGELAIRFSHSERYGTHAYRFDVAPAANMDLRVGGRGRAVAGRFAPVPPESTGPQATLYLLPPGSEGLLSAKTDDERIAIRTRAQHLPTYQSYLSNPDKDYRVNINPDGAFRFEDVAPGLYELQAGFGIDYPDRYYGESLGAARSYVNVPESGAAEPVEVGTLAVQLNARIKVGDTAPDLVGIDGLGRQMTLSQLHGKYVLLSICPPWQDDYMWREILKTIPLYDRFRDNSAFAMVSFYGDGGGPAPGDKTTLPWPSLKLQRTDYSTVPDEYLTSGEMILLIDPQGKLLAKNLNPQRAYYAIDHVLPRPTHHAAGIRIDVSYSPPAPGTVSEQAHVPWPPGPRNLAAAATFQVIDSLTVRSTDVLHDGTMLRNDDDDPHAFCFRFGTFEGRVKVDLGRQESVDRIITYSRHKSDRAPQVYTVYGSDGKSSAFDPAPATGTDPAAHGWRKIASVDTRPASGRPGGSYAVTLSNSSGALGTYRYLLFEMFPTEVVDPFGHTFYGEIEIIGRK